MPNFMEYQDAVEILSDVKKKEKKFRYKTMPPAGSDYKDQIIQYIGESSGNYINGYSYKCIAEGGGYVWKETGTSAGGSKSVVVNLSASGWNNGTQTVSVEGMTADVNGIVGLAISASSTQRVAARDAALSLSAQGNGYITMVADGDTPEVDLPINILIF